jgi:hypothetical protein
LKVVLNLSTVKKSREVIIFINLTSREKSRDWKKLALQKKFYRQAKTDKVMKKLIL